MLKFKVNIKQTWHQKLIKVNEISLFINKEIKLIHKYDLSCKVYNKKLFIF